MNDVTIEVFFYMSLQIQNMGDCRSPQLPIINSRSANSLHKLVRKLNCCFPLSFNMSCEYQILQALFPHYVLQKFQLSLFDSKYKYPLFLFFLNLPHDSHVLSLVFSASCYRTTFLLSEASFSSEEILLHLLPLRRTCII